jgi:hypothetical protein
VCREPSSDTADRSIGFRGGILERGGIEVTQFFSSAALWKFGAHSFIHMLFEGKAAQDGFSAYFFNQPRWGDYSAAAVGPDGSIWIATEMIPGGFRKGSANWGTFVGRSHRGEHDDQ